MTLLALYFACAIALLGTFFIRVRNLHTWLPGYVSQSFRSAGTRKSKDDSPLDLLVCLADHFEPLWNQVDMKTAQKRVDHWMKHYPPLALKHRDSDDHSLRHTFFFPGEQYEPKWIKSLSDLCRAGMAEVEIHLHHGYDTSASVERKLTDFRDQLAEHRLLSVERGSGKPRYAFIHGDWALANSGADAATCGVANEIGVLLNTGCYADFTLPSAPSPTQIPTVNRIFFADPQRRGFKPHATGVEAEIGRFRERELLLIEGPLTLNWSRRKLGLLPRIENGDLSASNPPHPIRVPLWINAGIHVGGRPEWRFIKLHMHGAPERHHEALLGESMDRFLSHLERDYNDGRSFRLHYVTAREMYNIARAAMDGKTGNPGEYRDYKLIPRWREEHV